MVPREYLHAEPREASDRSVRECRGQIQVGRVGCESVHFNQSAKYDTLVISKDLSARLAGIDVEAVVNGILGIDQVRMQEPVELPHRVISVGPVAWQTIRKGRSNKQIQLIGDRGRICSHL